MAKSKRDYSVESLSPRARVFVKQKQARFRDRFSIVRRTLNELADFDAGVDVLRGRAGGWMVGSGVLLFLCLFGTVFLFGMSQDGNVPEFAPFIPMGIGAFSLFMFIWKTIEWNHYRGLDLPNDLRITLAPTIDALEEDIGVKGKVEMSLDLTGATKQKISGKERLPAGGRVRKKVATYYDDRWCEMNVDLLDGTKLSLSIHNTPIKINMTKRNARGKTKFKTKWKKISEVTVTLRPDPSKFQVNEPGGASDVIGKFKTKDKGDARVCRLSRKYKYRQSRGENGVPQESVPPHDVIEMLMQVYSQFQLNQAGGAA